MSTQLKKFIQIFELFAMIQQFPRNFLCWQALGCISIYSFKSMPSVFISLQKKQNSTNTWLTTTIGTAI